MSEDTDLNDLINEAEQYYRDEIDSMRFAAQREEEEEIEPPEEEELEEEEKEIQVIIKREEEKKQQQQQQSNNNNNEIPGFHNSYKEYFSRLPELGQREQTITLNTGERYYYTINKSTKTTLVPPKKTSRFDYWTQQVDAKTFANIQNEAGVQLLIDKKVEEVRLDAVAAAAANNSSTTSATTSSSKKLLKKTIIHNNQPPLVQKYSPKRFVDLLSHEKRNREALKWLKSWDKVENNNPSQFLRPQKILLLAGPPGSGKTTMSHVIAKHAGYRVVEINASDERTSTSLKERISSATEMQSVFEANGKYNLVVLDEIDGATDGIQFLLQYANDPNKLRPIVCTCNDAYVPVLRQLRKVALVLSVALPTRSRLVKRLREICLEEKIDFKPGALELLTARMDGDIRASLNALDFWRRSYRHRLLNETENDSTKVVLDLESIKRLPAHSKDGTADLWTSWKSILQPNRTKRLELDLFSSITRHISDIDLVIDGIHENFPRNHYLDPTFSKTWKAYDWLSIVDVIQTRIGRDMDFSFAPYTCISCIGVGHAVSGGTSPSKMIFPHPISQYRAKKHRNEEILKEFFQTTITGIRAREFVTDFVTPFIQILVPRVRPVPFQAMSSNEKVEFERVVNLMNEYGLRWEEKKREENTNNSFQSLREVLWGLDPPIELLACFDSVSNFMILSEIAKGLNLRAKKRINHDDTQVVSTISSNTKKSKSKEGEPAKSLPMDIQQNHQPPVVRSGYKLDFFGREVKIEEQNSAVPQQTHEFVFKFNEGFTDAVRRPVKMNTFL